jgi:hypothetical protein
MRQWWKRLRCRHHFHNMGPIELGRCGGAIRYDWECCMCAAHTRSYYENCVTAMRGTSISPDEERELKRNGRQHASA